MVDYMEATDGISARDRQDFAFELIRESAELPSDYAYRSFRDFIYHKRYPLIIRQQLENWLAEYLEADEKARKEFLSQLRQTIS